MTRTEVAEAMIDGSLNYKPSNDAFFIAQGYLNLVKLMQMTKRHLPEDELKLVDEFLSFDPAKT